MLTKELVDALNVQIQKEFASAYLYLSMSSYCEAQNLPGFAKWLRIQWQEETEHAMKLHDYLQARGGRALLHGIEKPPAEFKSAFDVFQEVLKHEQGVTASIHGLYELAVKSKDYATEVELQWFVREQVEEEKNATEIVELMKRVGDSPAMLLMVDRQLGARARG